ncbi:phosphoribosylaminoimidazolesuccinocarboxamide synthase [Caldichromatium japonicum]|uniref:Phosphoribosylaminoimidazole-succinocarboxamide synthase n=1 Tax=Caldichromatium japonicum TaxID=2699430 RepID=A0A6G7VGX6_9GAMM|nr:phosphoribosylaminoimidazolesuccinocarboxamide synthase [Caldichromatium japonicum]QIK39244.1 phosphoribosylaminoimidazolesuccinocarboxamide synthase [Caldichromatium japonicum]
MSALYQANLSGFELIGRGKVRDLYRIDDEHLLFVTTDRLSAFDVILPQPIPGKGEVLARLSRFWFGRTQDLVPNHLVQVPVAAVVQDPELIAELGDRALVVKRLTPLPVEAIVRGYLIGSGWKDYQATGAVCGIALPEGLRLAERLPEPIFTPSTKAAVGAHDENIPFAEVVRLLGSELAAEVRDLSLAIYRRCADYARERGIIIADTKFEFGLDESGRLHLIDEVLTPDSSRFWPTDQYQIGISPPSFDKQFVRDYLESIGWDKRPPAPVLPDEIIARTAAKYREAEQRLTIKI